MSEVEKIEEEVDPVENEGPTIEERAEQMGWKPKDIYKGDPENWTDAEKFVQRGEEELPLLRSQLRKVQSDFHSTKRELSDVKTSMDTWVDMQVQSKLKAAKVQMEEAVADGDVEKFKSAQSDYEEAAKPVEKKQTSPDDLFAERNPWYNNDYDKTQEAIKYSKFLFNKGVEGEDMFKQVEAHIDKKFKEKPPRVEGGGSSKKSSSKGKTWAQIPVEDKKDVEKLVRSLGKTQDEVAKLYWENQNA